MGGKCFILTRRLNKVFNVLRIQQHEVWKNKTNYECFIGKNS